MVNLSNYMAYVLIIGETSNLIYRMGNGTIIDNLLTVYELHND